jgi:hypothetical protein
MHMLERTERQNDMSRDMLHLLLLLDCMRVCRGVC